MAAAEAGAGEDGGGGGGLLELLTEKVPESLYTFHHAYRTPTSSPRHENFLKGVKWSPDGACFVTASDDSYLRVYDLPADALERPAVAAGDGDAPGDDSFPVALAVHGGETLYDYCWYPLMVATDVVSCCFASTSRAHPIHMWDACSGSLRCSYRAYDHNDEITAAYSLAFSPSGEQLWAGYNKMLRVFRVDRPGREYREVPTLNKRAREGQSGIISCLAFAQDNSDGVGLMAAGSYNKTVGVYATDTLEQLYVLQGHRGGVTQVQFSPDGNYLYSGARRDGAVLCWDVRFTQSTLYEIRRESTLTNQRIGFDIEPCGRHLATGGDDGVVRLFDLKDGSEALRWQAAPDAVNGFSFNPRVPVAATSSGHRQFPLAPSSGDDSGSDEDEGAGAGGRQAKRARGASGGCPYWNSLRVWRFDYQWRPF